MMTVSKLVSEIIMLFYMDVFNTVATFFFNSLLLNVDIDNFIFLSPSLILQDLKNLCSTLLILKVLLEEIHFSTFLFS